MKLKILFLLSLFPMLVFGKEGTPDALDITESTHIVESLFYTGTCHYRNQEYSLSALSWNKIAVMENIEPDFQELQISSLNIYKV